MVGVEIGKEQIHNLDEKIQKEDERMKVSLMDVVEMDPISKKGITPEEFDRDGLLWENNGNIFDCLRRAAFIIQRLELNDGR